MAEKPLTNRVLAEIRRRGGYAEKIHGGPLQQAGIPDVIACYRGRFFGIEVKDDERLEPTDLQKYVLGLIRAAGGIALLVRSKNEYDRMCEMLDEFEED